MATTIYDIAKDTGYSPSTVSLVLNKKETNVRISEKAKNIIMDTVDRLQYHPNSLARSLRQQKSHAIGVAFAGHLEAMSDPIISEILSGIGTAVNDTPYSIYLFSRFDKITQVSLEAAKGKKVDGLIYFVYNRTFNTFNTVFGPELDKHTIPYIGIQFFSHFDNTNVVRVDVDKASELAVEHLAESGRKEMGLVIDNLESFDCTEAIEGFHRTAAENRITKTAVHEINLVRNISPKAVYKEGYGLAEELVKKRGLLESYYIQSDMAACGFVDCLKDKGKKTPEDTAVIGFGNLSGWGREQGFLTTIDCKYAERGKEAGQRLVEMLEGKAKDMPEGILLEPELIVRKSSITPVDN